MPVSLKSPLSTIDTPVRRAENNLGADALSPAMPPTYKPGSTGAFRAEDLADRLDTVYVPRHEAGLLFAAGYADAAAALLKAHIRETAGKLDMRAWLMLLDLYQMSGNTREFGALSIVFASRFARAAPGWDKSRCGKFTSTGEPAQSDTHDVWVLTPAEGGALLEDIDRFEHFAYQSSRPQIDFSQVRDLLPEEAELLALVLLRIRREGIPLAIAQPDGALGFVKKMIPSCQLLQTRGYWTLLFALLMVDDRAEDYENAALEFSVAFDDTAPRWEQVAVANRHAARGKVVPGTTAASRATAGFKLEGVISATDKAALADLSQFALVVDDVTVDMDKVTRIDFDAGGFFYECIRQLRLTGKKVILANLNEPVTALLEVFDVQHHAVLVTRTPH